MVALEYIKDFAEFYEKHKEDIAGHYEEYSSHFGDNKEVNLNIEVHQNLIDLGLFHGFKILVDEVYAGYVSMTTAPSMLFADETEVTVNHIFIKKEYRGKFIATDVIKLLEDFFIQEDILDYNLALPDTQAHRKFAERLGMKASSVTYVKDLRS